ncbi:MAG: hypothetical protein RL494_312 [Bacteroidota bacterium]|jgi:hypothetical protein
MSDINNKLNLTIENCLKDFISLEGINIPLEIRDEEADGNVILEFSDSSMFLLYGVTESSFLVIDDDLQLYENDKSRFVNISSNKFWSTRIGVEITNIEELMDGDTRFGIRFYLKNNSHFEICYYWDTEYDSETTVIRPYPSN